MSKVLLVCLYLPLFFLPLAGEGCEKQTGTCVDPTYELLQKEQEKALGLPGPITSCSNSSHLYIHHKDIENGSIYSLRHVPSKNSEALVIASLKSPPEAVTVRLLAQNDISPPLSVEFRQKLEAPEEGSMRTSTTTTWSIGSPIYVRSVGHTSLVWKITSKNHENWVFKPSNRLGRFRYKGEIAASRLGFFLNLNKHVSDVRPCDISIENKKGWLRHKEWKEFHVDLHGTDKPIHGACMPWEPDLSFLPLESELMHGRWKTWLSKTAQVPNEKKKLALELSTMIVFDYLIGNFDRFSGQNIGYLAHADSLFFTDNDAAFLDPIPKLALARQRALMQSTLFFNEQLIAKIRTLDLATLTVLFGEDLPGEPLLSEAALVALLHRRDEILKAVDAAIKKQGEKLTFSP